MSNKITPNPYNFVCEITRDSEKRKKLDKLLKVIRDYPANNSIIPFEKITSIFFCRFVVIDNTPKLDRNDIEALPPYLIFASVYSGSLDDHLLQLIKIGNSGLRDILSPCKGFDSAIFSSDDKVLNWIKQHSQRTECFYRGYWIKELRQICYEERSRQFAEDYLNSLTNQNLKASQIKDRLTKYIRDKQLDEQFEKIEPPKFHWALVFIIPLFIVPLLLVILGLLIAEARDKIWQKKYNDHLQTLKLMELEDQIVQNQLTHVVLVKKGWFRFYLLKFILRFIDYAARIYYNKGKLGGIPSIHYARWLFIDNGKRLVFFSNYEGSWENYLGDFIDLAAVGLNAVWANTNQYVKTHLMLWQGARDAQRFKSWVRTHQIPTGAWYSAVPKLSVKNILNNREIQKGYAKTMQSGQEIQEWLARF